MAYSAWYGDHVSLKYLSSHKPKVQWLSCGFFFYFFFWVFFLYIICTRKCMSTGTQHIGPWAVLVIIWNVWFSNKFELLMGQEFHMNCHEVNVRGFIYGKSCWCSLCLVTRLCLKNVNPYLHCHMVLPGHNVLMEFSGEKCLHKHVSLLDKLVADGGFFSVLVLNPY